MAKRTPIPSGNSGNTGPSAEELSKLGLLAIYSCGIVEGVNTRFGPTDAVDIVFTQIHADGTTGKLSEARLFSTVLFDTLSCAIGSWVAGRIVKPAGKRYWALYEAEDSEDNAVDRALAGLPDKPVTLEDKGVEAITNAFDSDTFPDDDEPY